MSDDSPSFVMDWKKEETETEQEYYRALYHDLVVNKGMAFVPAWPCQHCKKMDWQEWRWVTGHTPDGKRLAASEWDEAEKQGWLFYCSPACWDAWRYEGVEPEPGEVQELLEEWRENPDG